MLTTERHGPIHAGEARALARARYTTQSLSSYGRADPAGRVVVHAADVYPVYDAIPYRRAALDDPCMGLF